MAWQSPSAHNPGGGAGGGGGNGNNNINNNHLNNNINNNNNGNNNNNNNGNGNGGNGQGMPGGGGGGTEYTLQGVMRFLQTEWHRHERDRNSWEIERAEMKARIAKLEGENRASKRLQQGSEAMVKMLEMALKRERSGKTDGAAAQQQQQQQQTAQGGSAPTGPVLSPTLPNPYKADEGRTRSRVYLEKCLQEITYLLTPPSHPPPQQQLQQQMMGAGLMGQNFQGGMGGGDPHQQVQQLAMDHMNSQQLHAQAAAAAQQQQQQQHLQQQHQQSESQQQQTSAYDARSKRFFSLGRGDDGGAGNHSGQPRQESILEKIGNEFHSNNLPSSGGQGGDENNNSNNSNINNISSSLFKPSSLDELTNKDLDGWDFDDLSEINPTFQNKPAKNEPPQPVTSGWNPSTRSRGYSSVKNGNLRIGSRGRKNSMSRRMSAQEAKDYAGSISNKAGDAGNFKVRFALRGHLDVVRAVVFTGGGNPAEPEICTAGDDGVLKRWYLPGTYGIHAGLDVDVPSHFTHRGHVGIVTCLAACPPGGVSGEQNLNQQSQHHGQGGELVSSSSSNSNYNPQGDGWIFSGGQDATIKVWERGRVEAKATLVGHTDTVWTICVLPASASASSDRGLLASGAADGTVKIWAFSMPVVGAAGGTKGSGFGPFTYSLVTTITRPDLLVSVVDVDIPTKGDDGDEKEKEKENKDKDKESQKQTQKHVSPTCITPLSITGDTFIVSYTDAAVIIYDTATGEQVSSMASGETYDGTMASGVNCVVATTVGLDGSVHHGGSGGSGSEQDGKDGDGGSGGAEEKIEGGSTGTRDGVHGVVISGHEDRYIRFFDANSGQCTYTMLAHPAPISSLALSPDGRELVSGGHDASLRFWSMEKRSCIKEMTTHRLMSGEGVCCVIWSRDGRFVVSGGGDGVVKVYSR